MDLPSQSPGAARRREVGFPIDGFSKTCLLEGVDELGYLLALESAIARYEAAHPARVDTHAAMALSRS